MSNTTEKQIQKVEWLSQSFVTEWLELKNLLECLQINSPDSIFIRSQIILEKYQEQSNLLDAHTRSIVTIITNKIIEKCNLELFKEYLNNNTEKLTNDNINILLFIQKCFSLLYILSKVRGYKIILKYYPHQVERVEELENLIHIFRLDYIKEQLNNNININTDKDFATVTSKSESGHILHFACNSIFCTELWHVEYIGSLWLSVAILIPFNLMIIDSNNINNNSIGIRILNWCKNGLINNYRENTPPLVSCSILIGKLLARPDMKDLLSNFINWCILYLEKPTSTYFENEDDTTATSSQKSNILVGLSSVLKFGNRKELLYFSNEFVKIIEIISDIVQNTGAMQRKLITKVSGRIGITFLLPRVNQYWHYQKGTKSLLTGKTKQIIIHDSNNNQEDEDDDLDEDTSNIIEQIIGILLDGIKDTDTKVRWSSARRISDLTARLPKSFADQVIEYILELFSPLEEDGAWHGACLTLAEMSRKGVLIIDRLNDAIDVVKKAFIYDVKRGSSSRGSHVRDAACYVAWAFARSFNPSTLEPFIQSLANSLIVMCLFDREVNCRRAAAAAFQEIVGRQGGPSCSNMAHGIDIVTNADYFSLGNRKDSYLLIAPTIIQYKEYQNILLNHLIEYKRFHWDLHIRELAAQSLGRCASIAPEYMINNALPKIIIDCTSSRVQHRHGSIYAVAEIIRALSTAKISINLELQNDILCIIQTIEQNRLFRGRGGEMVRMATCHLIEAISYSRFVLPASLNNKTKTKNTKQVPFTRKQKSTKILIQEMINEHLKHPNEDIQLAGTRCIRQFSLRYHSTKSPASCKALNNIIDFYIKHIKTDPIPSTRRGYTLALGALSPSVITLRLNEIIDTLIDTIKIPDNKELRDAETRRNALEALMELCEKMKRIDGVMSLELYQKIFNGMLQALNDYSIDNRGDVGSWIRETALLCLTNLTFLLARKYQNDNSTQWFTEENGISLICGILKQCSEKIDKLRFLAASYLGFLLYSYDSVIMDHSKASIALRSRQKIVWDQIQCSSYKEKQSWLPVTVPFIPKREILLSIIPPEETQYTSWANVQQIYNKIIPLMKSYKPFRIPILTGICSSVGGMSKQVVTYSTNALLEYTTLLKNNKDNLVEFANDLVLVGKQNENNEYLSIPYLKTLLVLLTNQILESIQPPEYDFSYQLILLIRKQIRSSKDIRKLLDIVDVTVNLLQFKDPTQSITIKCLLTLLSHRYPKVRKLAGEQFYVSIITFETTFSYIKKEEKDKILDILSKTSWEHEEIPKLKPIILELQKILKN